MSTQRPEALRLADLLEHHDGWHYPMGTPQELRRLHALNQELLEALKDTLALIDVLMPGVRYIPLQDYAVLNETPLKARAAIAKAEKPTMTDKICIDRAVVAQALETLSIQHVESFMSKRVQAITALRAALEQPRVEQSSVVGVIGWKNHLPNSGTVVHWTALMPPLGTKLYTHPQPPRQPLTDAQINDHRLALAYDSEDLPDPWDFKQGVRAAERAHGIGGEK